METSVRWLVLLVDFLVLIRTFPYGRGQFSGDWLLSVVLFIMQPQYCGHIRLISWLFWFILAWYTHFKNSIFVLIFISTTLIRGAPLVYFQTENCSHSLNSIDENSLSCWCRWYWFLGAQREKGNCASLYAMWMFRVCVYNKARPRAFLGVKRKINKLLKTVAESWSFCYASAPRYLNLKLELFAFCRYIHHFSVWLDSYIKCS